MPDPSWQAEQEKRRGQLRSLCNAVYSSMSSFDRDIETLSNELKCVNCSNSPVAEAMIACLNSKLSDDSCDQEYKDAYSTVLNSIS